MKPRTGDYPPPFHGYISLVEESDISEAFKKQYQPALDFLGSINEEKSAFAYAEGKWSVKEMMQHIIDAERIFNYRALCIARGEQQSLPGFDENEYALRSNGNARLWPDLLEEFVSVRHSTTLLFNSFTTEMLSCKGLSNGHLATVNSFGFITVGHLKHHLTILKDRYLL